jgi:hypothetical protein
MPLGYDGMLARRSISSVIRSGPRLLSTGRYNLDPCAIDMSLLFGRR